VAVREDVGIHIHTSETADQVLQSQKNYDMSPIEFLAHRGLFETHTIAAHAIHANDVDLGILAAKDVNVVQCPSTHLKYAMGVTRVPELLERGINVALGTDGAGSSAALSLWREMRLAVLMQRQAHGDATLLGGSQPLYMATSNGARALGFHSTGVLSPGFAADLIVVNTQASHFQPIHDVTAALVWCTEAADVQDVMVAGRWLMRDRKLLTINEETVLAGFRGALAQMLGTSLKQFREYQG
jgi:5-methylthioadenosine/S-adenosylhomocysteine deaminase